MGDTSLLFNLIGRDLVSPAAGTAGSAFTRLGQVATLALAGIAAKSIHMAGDFQKAMTRVQTGAGESAANIAADSRGILKMMGDVGSSAKQLTTALYVVNSAGFHGSAGLKVLEVSAKGAKVGAADLGVTANALTTALNAWKIPADHATEAMNALIAAEANGKTTLEALAAALPTVAPVASLAGISLNEVAAAMATMTAQGTPAEQAATYLRQTIGQLSAPTQKARKEMEALGLDANKVSLQLGKGGLASTLTMLTDAIQRKMGPAGLVVLDTLKKASNSTSDFEKVLANLPHDQQTVVGALASMVGGVKSMQAALQLTGPNMETFQKNIAAVNRQVHEGGSEVEGWAAVQKNFNQKLDEAKGKTEALGIKLGVALLPSATRCVEAMSGLTDWMEKHHHVAKGLLVTIGLLSGAYVAHAITLKACAAAEATWNIAKRVGKYLSEQTLLMSAISNPYVLAVLAIAAVVYGIYYLWKHCEGFRDFWIGLWRTIKNSAKAVADWISGPFVGFFAKSGKAIERGWDSVVSFFHKLPSRIISGIRSLPGVLIRLATSWMKSLAYGLGFGIGYVVGFIIKLPGRIVKALVGLSTMLGRWAADAMSHARESFERASATIISWALKVPGRIRDAVSRLPSLLAQWGTNAVNSARDAVVSASERIYAWARELPDRILDFIRGLPGRMRSLGSDIVNGLADGIQAAAGRLWGLAKDLASKFLDGFKKAMKISSPSAVMVQLAVDGIGAGLIRGLSSVENPAHNSGARLAGKVASGFVSSPRASGSAGLVQGRQGAQQVVIRIDSGGNQVDKALVDLLRKSIRSRGGNVQAVLGRG